MDEIQRAVDAHMANGASYTRAYMDEVKKALKISSDYELAKRLQVSKTTVSNYTNGRAYFSPAVCFRVADILNIDGAVVLSAIEVDRHSGHGQKLASTWAYIHQITRQMQSGFANVALLALLAIFSIAAIALPAWAAIYSASLSANSMYIMLSRLARVIYARVATNVKVCKEVDRVVNYVPRHPHPAAFRPAG